ARAGSARQRRCAGRRATTLGSDRPGPRSHPASRLYILEDGKSRPLSEGPADLTPAWSPDGRRIAFAAPTRRGQSDIPRACPGAIEDADLYTIAPDGSQRRLVVREPLADQTGPVWSADSRYLFATSVYRSVDSCKSLLSSITVVDTRADPPVVRALHDPNQIEPRTGPAVAAGPLDSAALGGNRPYGEALKRAILRQLNRADPAQPQPPLSE
ncbi:MAG: hypothetical protein AAGC55_25630, partial [Myxococcota bacterium]